jgi:predicted ABC-type ATPase
MPNVVILAGPNGAGKTSSAAALLRDVYRVSEFVNADVIARGLSAFSADAAAVEAGRIMLRRLEELVFQRQDFAFETTLAGTGFLRAIERWRSRGYVIRLVFLWVESVDVAIARVHQRAKQGGHFIPDHVVRRRYLRGLVNFANSYRDSADEWQLYDNTGLERRLIARGTRGTAEIVVAHRWVEFERAVARVARVQEALVENRPPIPNDHLARCFRDASAIELGMRIAYARVIRRHRLLNEPLVVGRNGEVVLLDPNTVPMPEGVTEEQLGPVFDYL